MNKPKLTSKLHALSSVKGRIIVGFGLLVVVLITVVAGSAWLARKHQTDLDTMEHHTYIADLLQETEIASGTTATFLYGYVNTGNQLLLPTLQSSLDSSQRSMDEAVAIEKASGHDHVPNLEELYKVRGELTKSTEDLIALAQAGEQGRAMTGLETVTPKYMQWVLGLTQAVNSEQEQASALKSRAEQTGDLAFWLLVISGTVGASFGLAASLFVARSILKPLSSLESTARAVAAGDMDARSDTRGPRELKHLGETLNSMIATVQQRTDDLRLANEELQERYRQLTEARTQAATDALTGLGNHRAFHLRIGEEIQRAAEIGTPVGLIMLDIDGFKGVNDSKGHLVGDEILRAVAHALASEAGREDAYRYGGDEFAVIVVGGDRQTTSRMAEALRRAVASEGNGDNGKVTISLGISSFPETAESAEELVYRADAAMYWAKSAGKNRVGDWSNLAETPASDGETPATERREGAETPGVPAGPRT
jgi:diguanylate cyclase (GGDEF)-like protein